MGNLDVAIDLAEAGLHVFPCEESGPRRKQPKPGTRWRQASVAGRERVIVLWSNWRDAVPGIDAGKSGLLVIDCDRKIEADGVEAFALLADEHAYDLSLVPQVSTPSGGIHFYFRQPTSEAHGNATGGLPKGIDVRGDGGYVIGPGARFTDDGRQYELLGDLGIHEAPACPRWLWDQLKAPKPGHGAPVEPVTYTAAPPTTTGDARSRSYIASALAGEIEAVRQAPTGARNQTLNDAALKMGHYVGSGLISEGEVRQALISAAMTSGLVKDDGLKQCEATIRSGLRAGMAEPKGIPAAPAQETITTGILSTPSNESRRGLVEQEDGSFFDAQTGELVEPIAVAQNDNIDVDLPPGLVGDVARWICDTARRPSPLLALAASLSVVGTMAGRHYAGPTRSGTHLYVLGLALTGAGKDHVLQQAKRLMIAANCEHHLGPSEFISMTSVINLLQRKPLALVPMDEFGDFLRRINSKKASGFEASISKILRSLWGSSFQPYSTPEWAGREFVTIMAPSISLFGVSTHEQFYMALEGSAAEDGTLNRWLMLDCGRARPADRDPKQDPSLVPPELRLAMKALYEDDNPFLASQRNTITLEPDPVVLAWGRGAQDIYKAYQTDTERAGDQDHVHATFHARAAEMAVRIATIVALGRGERSVSAEDITYGVALASRSAQSMMAGAADYMSDSEHHENVNRIRRALKGNGGILKHRDLQRGPAKRMRARDLKDALTTLVEAEEVEIVSVQTDRGPDTQAYRLIA